MSVFERYLGLWVAACMALGIAVGKLFSAFVSGGVTPAGADAARD